MISSEEWLEQMFGRGNWVAADTTTLKAIQRDALLEAADIASSFLYAGQNNPTGRNIHYAILTKAKELE